MNYIYGINAVAEALKARGRSFEWVGVLKERHDLRLQRVVEECRRNGVAVRFLGRPELDRMAGNNAHQGVVAVTSAKQYNDLDDVVAAKRGQYSLVVVLDGIEDPHNLGAILRTADASGADGVVIPERRAAGVTATVTKASAGASEHLPIAKVTNIARTLEELKDKESVDRGPGRARHAELRRARLQHGLRHRAGLRRQGRPRSGGEEVRLPGFHSHAGEGAVAECVGGRGSDVVRNRAPAQDKGCGYKMKFLRVLCVLCGLLVRPHALDREAFTFTNYDLDVRIEPEQQRLAVRGKITLRNDSDIAAEKSVAADFFHPGLEIDSDSTASRSSSSLSPTPPTSITPARFRKRSSPCPERSPPKGTVELEIGYEGIIPLDATRLTRIGVPEERGPTQRLGPDRQIVHRGARHRIRGLVSGGDRVGESCRKATACSKRSRDGRRAKLRSAA